ncbi:phage antirepressor KilAC domain-containing protein [Faecalibacterium prausnitzii]|jgi:prophage pi1 protein 08|uniref:phage antirepressor KilAC domain-containing protein n=1 Tax=Faecalibacterium prausnitzii TaxID=853 RepID=UPI00206B4C7E|nr:phage antirepressor KilAC domain-containing protein [Faecalibacterium prausnitzii]DAU42635.1 MAG TPA: repressor domain protein [Caudoviricetes sp.]
MNDMQIFNNPDFGTVRTLDDDGMILFCASDIATALGYARPKDAVAAHCKGAVKRRTLTNGGEQEMSFIPESDLYRLVFGSKLPTAEKFTDWVTSEVLPSIRKHGAYMTPETLQAAILNPDTMIQLCQQLKAEQDKNAALTAANSQLTVDKQIMQPKADYFDELVDRNLLTSFRETAKQLEIKEKVLIQFLLEKKYIYRDKKGKLMPYAEKNNGLFEVKECFNEKTQWSGTQTLVTPKGRETFRLLYLKTV